MEVVELLKLFGDETRLRIVSLLYDCPCFVRDIHTILQIQQSNTSRHLQRLTNTRVVANKQCGQSTCYYIEPTIYNHPLVQLVVLEFKKSKQAQQDISRLQKYTEENPGMIQKLGQYQMLKEKSYA